MSALGIRLLNNAAAEVFVVQAGCELSVGRRKKGGLQHAIDMRCSGVSGAGVSFTTQEGDDVVCAVNNADKAVRVFPSGNIGDGLGCTERVTYWTHKCSTAPRRRTRGCLSRSGRCWS